MKFTVINVISYLIHFGLLWFITNVNKLDESNENIPVKLNFCYKLWFMSQTAQWKYSYKNTLYTQIRNLIAPHCRTIIYSAITDKVSTYLEYFFRKLLKPQNSKSVFCAQNIDHRVPNLLLNIVKVIGSWFGSLYYIAWLNFNNTYNCQSHSEIFSITLSTRLKVNYDNECDFTVVVIINL